MLDAVGGAGGIRTRILDNPDGTTTRLKTRAGAPEFVTSVNDTVSSTGLRGFVVALAIGVSALLGGVTTAWTIRKNKYVPKRHGYKVSAFVSQVNIYARRGFYWMDVWALFNGALYINGVQRYRHPGDSLAVPVVLCPSVSTYDSVISDRRPLFCVNPDKVAQVGIDGGAALTVELTPVEAISKSVKHGASTTLSVTTATANLAKTYYTGATWDDLGGTWRTSWLNLNLTRTSPYISTAGSGIENLEMAHCNPVAVSFNGIHYTEAGPVFPVFMAESGPYVRTDSNHIRPQYTQPEYGNSFGTRSSDGSEAIYEASISGSQVVRYVNGVAITLSWSEESTITHRIVSEGLTMHCAISRPITASGGSSKIVTYTTPYDFQTPGVSSGQNGVSTAEGGLGMTTTLSQKGNYESSVQTTTASISIGAGLPNLIDYDFSYELMWGTRCGAKDTGSWAGGGIDMSTEQACAYFDGSDPTFFENWMTASATGGASTKRMNYFGTVSEISNAEAYMDFTLDPIVESDTTSLSIITRDYLYFDSGEGVYAYVKGTFVGGSGDGGSTLDLVVSFVLRVRGVEYSTQLATITELALPLTYSILGTSTRYIKPVQLRTMFAPLYCEQGACRAIAYTTLAEQAQIPTVGATMLFDAYLQLVGYGAFGTEPASSSSTISFIPYQLLEMLYAHVFSDRYGVDPDERYPVNAPGNYSRVQTALFSGGWRISFDGTTFRNWPGDLGAAYATTTSPLEIART